MKKLRILIQLLKGLTATTAAVTITAISTQTAAAKTTTTPTAVQVQAQADQFVTPDTATITGQIGEFTAFTVIRNTAGVATIQVDVVQVENGVEKSAIQQSVSHIDSGQAYTTSSGAQFERVAGITGDFNKTVSAQFVESGQTTVGLVGVKTSNLNVAIDTSQAMAALTDTRASGAGSQVIGGQYNSERNTTVFTAILPVSKSIISITAVAQNHTLTLTAELNGQFMGVDTATQNTAEAQNRTPLNGIVVANANTQEVGHGVAT